jgi:hypothetical protein
VEAVAAQHDVADQAVPVDELDDRSVTQVDRRGRGHEADLPTRVAQRIDQVGDEQLLGIDAVLRPARRAVVVDLVSSAAELAGAKGGRSRYCPPSVPRLLGGRGGTLDGRPETLGGAALGVEAADVADVGVVVGATRPGF